jgi:hypothetical protein
MTPVSNGSSKSQSRSITHVNPLLTISMAAVLLTACGSGGSAQAAQDKSGITPDGQTARSGRYVRQPSGYRAFIPAPLPPSPPVAPVGDLHALLSKADRALRRLDGSVAIKAGK